MHLQQITTNLPIKIPTLSIADVIANKEDLSTRIMDVGRKGMLSMLPNISTSLLSVPQTVMNREEEEEAEEREIELKFLEGIVYVNGIEVIPRSATSRVLIFKVLLEQYLKDFTGGLGVEEHKFLTITQISELIEPYVGAGRDVEQQVRRPLNKIQKAVQEAMAQKLGVHVDRHCLIETKGWPGCSSKEYGYRLNPRTISFRKF